MANTIPCPNPTCSHRFSAADLKPGKMIQCPKCRFRIQGLKGTAAASSPAPPAAKIPVATFASPPTPEQIPVATFADPPSTGSEPPKRLLWSRRFFVGIGLASCIVVGVIVSIAWFPRSDPGKSLVPKTDGKDASGAVKAQDPTEKFAQLTLPESDWVAANDIQAKFGPNSVARKHAKEECWFVLSVHDYGTHSTRYSEMQRTGIVRLDAYFGKSLGLDLQLQPAGLIDLVTAEKFRFTGKLKEIVWSGECHLFFYNGVGYWLYLASPDESTIERFADEIPKNVKLLNDRQDWQEQPVPTETFVSLNGKLRLAAPKGGWEKHDARNENENGELLLSSRNPRDADKIRNATMLIFTMQRTTDLKEAIRAGQKQLESKLKAADNTFKLVQAGPGTAEDIGDRRVQLLELKGQRGGEDQRYYLLGVVNEPDVCYVIACQCAWNIRQLWREDFMDLLRGLSIKKGN